MAVEQKPYIRRAQVLVTLGLASIMALTWGLGEMSKNGMQVHEPFLTLSFLVPFGLIAAGVGFFIFGRARKL